MINVNNSFVEMEGLIFCKILFFKGVSSAIQITKKYTNNFDILKEYHYPYTFKLMLHLK